MKREAKIISALLGCTALAGLFPAPYAGAADLNKVIEVCATCHGKDGVSSESDVPTIAGFSKDYLAPTLTEYRNKARSCPETKIREGTKKGEKSDMCQSTKELSDDEIKQVAGYYAGKKFVPAKQEFDVALANKGKDIHDANCDKCHSDGGRVANDDAGMLSGQWMSYLRQQLTDMKSGERRVPKKMKSKVDDLDKASVDALLNYYGSNK